MRKIIDQLVILCQVSVTFMSGLRLFIRMKVMDNWQSLATYNKIGSYQFSVTGKRMSAEENEINKLDKTGNEKIYAIFCLVFGILGIESPERM